MTNTTTKISRTNSKLGAIPSVNLPPVITCHNCAHCSRKCYALKHMYGLYKSCKLAYDFNLELYRTNPTEYFETIKSVANTSRFFRWHASGDIVDAAYFDYMIAVANACKHTRFLCFTKAYDIVDKWIANNGQLPTNLQVIYSKWYNLTVPKNPHNLPTSQVINNEDELTSTQKLCPGNCAECAYVGSNCWTMDKGDEIAFKIH